jgi:Kinesin motor domain
MQRKGSESNSEKNIDIIPFRDSKLTHLLMPQLCRAGLSGVAMIACVNPQIDDYDETLSILG